MLEAEALETPMLYPDSIKQANGKEENYYQRSLPTVKPAPKGLEETLAKETIEWIKICNTRYV